MAVLVVMLQGILTAIIISCIAVLLIAAFRYMRADPEHRVLIVDAPERGNVIPFRNTRPGASGSNLVVRADFNPSRGGNA